MPRDLERLDRIQSALLEAGLDAVVCSIPENVLLATGYFPVVGTSVAVVTREREVILFAPEDEHEMASCDCSDRLITFQPGSLDTIGGAVEALREPLRRVMREKRLSGAVIGYECGPSYAPASYVAMHLYGSAIPELFSEATLRPAGNLLARLKSVLTPIELDRVRRACRIAAVGFQEGVRYIVPGVKETEAAEAFRRPLEVCGTGFEGVCRACGGMFCMSGKHSASAYGAYARSRSKEIEITDLVLVHCNSCADGYWTDITRTYCIAPASRRQKEMYEAVFEARQAALDAIRPGAAAAAVDAAARGVMRRRGFGDQFKHPTGHGVGLAAIDHNALPRIHPKSDARLECGMVFNIEPAIYIEDFGGLRHCDMVAVTETGAELLTPFQLHLEELIQ